MRLVLPLLHSPWGHSGSTGAQEGYIRALEELGLAVFLAQLGVGTALSCWKNACPWFIELEVGQVLKWDVYCPGLVFNFS